MSDQLFWKNQLVIFNRQNSLRGTVTIPLNTSKINLISDNEIEIFTKGEPTISATKLEDKDTPGISRSQSCVLAVVKRGEVPPKFAPEDQLIYKKIGEGRREGRAVDLWISDSIA